MTPTYGGQQRAAKTHRGFPVCSRNHYALCHELADILVAFHESAIGRQDMYQITEMSGWTRVRFCSVLHVIHIKSPHVSHLIVDREVMDGQSLKHLAVGSSEQPQKQSPIWNATLTSLPL